MATMNIVNVVIDCADPEQLVPFWEAATGYNRVWSNGEFIVLAPADRRRPNLLLQRVPEPKVTKNRVHVDLGATDLEAETRRLVELGATPIQAFELPVARWQVMTDPVGNEFCLSAVEPEPEPTSTTS
jgi:predicted enzyme related to lactoylglutathione lyase